LFAFSSLLSPKRRREEKICTRNGENIREERI
jgi:hypothetical protein